MKISYKWLGELTALTLSPAELAARLTMSGFAVDAVEAAGDDPVLDIDLTSNRPDGLSHIGIAREVALICGGSLRRPEISLAGGAMHEKPAATVEILDPDLCPRYAARIIKGVKVGPSPKWLVERLEIIGQRTVNNIADITNYVMFEMGQPTHAFDLSRLHGARIIVRRASKGEKLTTLDGLERELSTDMLVIADADRAVALAGIMGGEETEISAQTRDVLLESAYFNPSSVRRTARRLGIESEASQRFGRGGDWGAQVRAANRVSQLIVELAGGQVEGSVIDVFPSPPAVPAVRLRESRIERLSGLRVEIERAAEILRALEFEVEMRAAERELHAKAPSFRIDIAREEDLVEEVIRHAGYDRIVATLPAWSGAGAHLPDEARRREIRRSLTGLGFNEAISLSFADPEHDSLFRGERPAVTVANPIDVNQPDMRTSLLTGLLEAVQRNINHGSRDIKLFEIGRTFARSNEGERPVERTSLALTISGSLNPESWRGRRDADFYDLKGAVEAVLETLNLSGFTFERASVEYLHPGQSAVVRMDGLEVAQFGRLHPRTADIYRFRQPVYIAEIDLQKLLEWPGDPVRYSALPRLPSVSRDVSALVPENVSWDEIERAISGLGIPDISSVQVFDIYKGKGIPEGVRSIAFRVIYRAAGRTLTDEEVNASHERVRETIRDLFGAQLR
jgi:phenylalanyl-tRNA synthetase beta chain